jgi:hypothetical protein
MRKFILKSKKLINLYDFTEIILIITLLQDIFQVLIINIFSFQFNIDWVEHQC